MNAVDIRHELEKIADSERADHALSFFKTYDGGYGAGDKFYGLTVPASREIAKRYTILEISEVLTLLHSPYHEERFIALVILIAKYKKADEKTKREIYELYLANTTWINNWDLVDSSASQIVGEYLYEYFYSEPFDGAQGKLCERPSHVEDSSATLQNDNALKILKKLAYSENLWERRIAIIATFTFLKYHDASYTFAIAEVLLHDKHDLIHKAVGWALREAGKRVSEKEEKEFLDRHYKTMPRTMLRYAIERFSEEERKAYLLGQI